MYTYMYQYIFISLRTVVYSVEIIEVFPLILHLTTLMFSVTYLIKSGNQIFFVWLVCLSISLPVTHTCIFLPFIILSVYYEELVHNIRSLILWLTIHTTFLLSFNFNTHKFCHKNVLWWHLIQMQETSSVRFRFLTLNVLDLRKGWTQLS